MDNMYDEAKYQKAVDMGMQIEPIGRVVHVKTGNYYFVIRRDVIECTNGREEKKYVLYYRNGMFFCREQGEFDQKFKVV